MSAFRRMIGRELPCTLLDVLDLPLERLTALEHEQLRWQCERGAADPEAQYRLALSHLAREEFGLARRALQSLRPRRSASARARVGLAVICEQLGDHAQAARHLNWMLEEDRNASASPRRYALLCAAGFAQERSGDWRGAKARYIAALSTQPDDLFAHHRLAAIYLAHGEHAEAVGCMREILRQNPQELSARICRAHLLSKAGQHAEAIWEYEQAMCLQPDGWEMPLDAAMQEMADDAHAIDFLETLVGAQPHFADLRLRLGNLYSRCGQDEAAIAAFEQALELHPEYLEGHIAAARHELRMGRTDAAVDHFRLALAINDQNIEAYSGLAVALRAVGRHRQADEMLASAARLAGNSAMLTAQLGVLASGEAGEASIDGRLDSTTISSLAQRCEEALMENPSAGDLRLRWSMLCRLLGRRQEAMDALRQLILEEPNAGEAWLTLSTFWTELGRKPDAEVAIHNALAPDRRSEELQYRLGLIYCGELEFNLTAEAVDEFDPDATNRILSSVEQMQLTGLTRRGVSRRSILWVADAQHQDHER